MRMVLAMTKGGKWEDQIKPLTELGVDRITPLLVIGQKSNKIVEALKIKLISGISWQWRLVNSPGIPGFPDLISQ